MLLRARREDDPAPRGDRRAGRPESTGTQDHLLPRHDDFHRGGIDFNFDYLTSRLRELAFLNPGITIELIDERGEQPRSVKTFFYEEGDPGIRRASWGEQGADPRERTDHRPEGQADGRDRRQWARRSLRTSASPTSCPAVYTGEYHENILCFANSIPNGDGGTHLSGFRSALTRAINNYAKG